MKSGGSGTAIPNTGSGGMYGPSVGGGGQKLVAFSCVLILTIAATILFAL